MARAPPQWRTPGVGEYAFMCDLICRFADHGLEGDLGIGEPCGDQCEAADARVQTRA